MNKKTKLKTMKFLKRFSSIIPIIIILAFSFWPIQVLEIYSLPDRSLLFRSKLPKTGDFKLHYIHSWDKTPVWDVFKINLLGQLVLEREEYLWMGAGLESYSGANIDFNGEYVSVKHNKNIGELQLAVGTVANHQLIIDSKEIALSNLVSPGNKVLIKTKILPLIVFYFERK